MSSRKISPNAAGRGRKPGVPNRLTLDVEHGLAILSGPGAIEARAARCIAWLKRIARKDPGRACEAFFGLLRKVVPSARVRPRRETILSAEKRASD